MNTAGNNQKLILCGLVVILIVLLVDLVWIGRKGIPGVTSGIAPQLGSAYSFAYLISCSGSYIKIDTEKQEIISQGKLWNAPSARVIQPSQLGRLDGCLINAVRHDPRTGLIYIVVPKEGNLDAEGRRHYRIASLKLPNFSLIGYLDLNTTLDAPPQILLNPQGSGLLVNYSEIQRIQNKEMRHDHVQHYRVPEFEQKRNIEDIYPLAAWETDPTRGLHISNSAYWGKAERIIDQDRLLDVNGRMFRRIDGYQLLTQSMREKFQILERIGVGAKKYLDITFADSAGGRVLFVIGEDRINAPMPIGSGLLIYDIENQRTLPAIVTPYRAVPFDPTAVGTPTVHLTPDGELAVLEQYEWRSLEQSSLASPNKGRFKTGEITVYNISTGSTARRIFLTPQPGFFGHIIGFSPDSTLMYYSSQEHIYAVYLDETGSPQTLPKPEGFSPVAIFFSGQ
jgi:hypothetical protein